MIRFSYSKNKSYKLRPDLSIDIIGMRPNLIFTLRSLGQPDETGDQQHGHAEEPSGRLEGLRQGEGPGAHDQVKHIEQTDLGGE